MAEGLSAIGTEHHHRGVAGAVDVAEEKVSELIKNGARIAQCGRRRVRAVARGEQRLGTQVTPPSMLVGEKSPPAPGVRATPLPSTETANSCLGLAGLTAIEPSAWEFRAWLRSMSVCGL